MTSTTAAEAAGPPDVSSRVVTSTTAAIAEAAGPPDVSSRVVTSSTIAAEAEAEAEAATLKRNAATRTDTENFMMEWSVVFDW